MKLSPNPRKSPFLHPFRYAFRILVAFSWIALIFLILYFPKWNPFSKAAHSITLFAWGDILDPAVIAAFEKESGISVHLNYYASNEELLVKMEATGGAGYDLVIPSDYAVSLLAQEGLLKPLDKKKLPFWDTLKPSLLNHPYDPDNCYSIPFAWEVFGLGYDTRYFKTPPFGSWKLLFEKPIYRVSMTNDPIEAIAFASFYLYGTLPSLTTAQVGGIKDLLFAQKHWVEAYASFRGDYFLATGNCPIVLSSSAYIRRAEQQFDFIDFLVPQEGSFLTIESLAIPKASKKEALTYAFIEYLYRKESLEAHEKTFGYFSPLAKANPYLDDSIKLHFIRPLLPAQQLRDLWTELKK